MSIDIGKVAGSLGKVLHIVNELMPVAEALGAPMLGPLTGMIAAASQMGENALTAIASGKAVSSSRDEDLIKAAWADIEKKNDDLAKLIAAS